jgi:hypothetical protein
VTLTVVQAPSVGAWTLLVLLASLFVWTGWVVGSEGWRTGEWIVARTRRTSRARHRASR